MPNIGVATTGKSRNFCFSTGNERKRFELLSFIVMQGNAEMKRE